MKKVLMVSYNYPPVGTIGWVRVAKLAKYLPARGWSPTVLTVSKDRTKWGKEHPAESSTPGVRVIRASFPDVLTRARRLLARAGLIRPAAGVDPGSSTGGAGAPGAVRRAAGAAASATGRWVALPDRYALWIPFAVARGLGELSGGGYDLILSTSPPVSCHVVASMLHRLSGLPWIADLRDPWSHPYMQHSPGRLRVNRFLEKATLENAAAITAVTAPFAESLQEQGGRRPGGVSFISNGYDPADYSDGVEVSEGRFVFTHTGSLFGLKRDPRPLLRVVEGLIDEGVIGAEELLFRFLGPAEPELARFCDGYKYPGVVRQEGVVSRTESIRYQQESTALLVLLWEYQSDGGEYTGKIFEYLGAGRPVLAWSPAGMITGELLRSTGAGVAVSDKDDLKRVLTAWFDEFRRSGRLAYHGDSAELKRYSWPELTGRFAGLFDDVIERRPWETF